MTNSTCACNKQQIADFKKDGGKREEITIPDCYYTLPSGKRIEGEFACRRPFPGECSVCYDHYVTKKMRDQFDPLEDDLLVWPPKEELPEPPKPKDRWVYTERDGWHVLKRPAAHAADVHLTMCRMGVNPVGAMFSDDIPLTKEEISCEGCRSRLD